MKTKRLYSIFSDGICGSIYFENGQYVERCKDVEDFIILDLDNFLLTLIYRGFTIKAFEPNAKELDRVMLPDTKSTVENVTKVQRI